MLIARDVGRGELGAAGGAADDAIGPGHPGEHHEQQHRARTTAGPVTLEAGSSPGGSVFSAQRSLAGSVEMRTEVIDIDFRGVSVGDTYNTVAPTHNTPGSKEWTDGEMLQFLTHNGFTSTIDCLLYTSPSPRD